MTKVNFRDSVLCATRGIFRTISSERNIKIQILLGSLMIFLAILLNISKTYLITIIIVCFLVIILELFNRGFEKLIDLVSPNYNKEFGKVKDIMAGVVLLTFIMSALVSVLILYNPLMNLLFELSKSFLSVFLLIGIILTIILFLIVNYFKERFVKA
jgi:diacylglycerol kinase